MSHKGNGKPIVEEHIGLAYILAKQFTKGRLRPNHPIEDTEEFADALMGLHKACLGFDPEKHKDQNGKPLEFSTFAYRCVYNEINSKQKVRRNQGKIAPVSLSAVAGPSNNKDGWTVFDIEDNSRPQLPVDLIAVFMSKHPDDTAADGRRKKVVYEYYINERTLKDIAVDEGCTKERVRQLRDEGIKLIQKRYADIMAEREDELG